MHHLYVVSDGTGRTAVQAINAALTQFPDTEIDIIQRPEVRSEHQAGAAIGEAREAGGFNRWQKFP